MSGHLPVPGVRWNEQVSTILSYMIVIAMMVCLTLTLVQVMTVTIPGFAVKHLPLLSVFLALESLYTSQIRRKITFWDWEWLAFHLAEVVVITIIVKLAIYAGKGLDQLVRDLPLWVSTYGAAFFDGEMIFSSVIAWLVWGASQSFAGALHYLRWDEKWLQIEADAGLSVDRLAARRRLANLILTSGAIMVLAASLVRVNVEVGWFQIPAMRVAVYYMLVYFLLGLVLLSMTQFSVLRIRWARQGIAIKRDLAIKWALYSFVFLAVVVVVVSFMPTGYTINFLNLLRILLGYLIFVANILFWLLTLPFLLLSSLIANLSGRRAAPPSVPPFVQTAAPPVSAVGEPLAWLEVLKSLVFWLVLIGLVSYSVYVYWKARSGDFAALGKYPWVRWLVRFWDWLLSWTRTINQGVSHLIQAGISRVQPPGRSLTNSRVWRYIHLRRIPPRERVMFFFYALLRHGAKSGFPRAPAQTPFEYTEYLAKQARQQRQTDQPSDLAAEDLQQMAQHFIEARYSRHEITNAQAEEVKGFWRRIRKLLRKWRQSGGWRSS